MSDSIQKRDNNSLQAGGGSFRFIPNFDFDINPPEDDRINPRKIISILLRYKWLILFFVIAGATGAYYYADSLTPSYSSTGKLMISSASTGPTDELSQIISQTTGHGLRSTLENELQVIQSRKFSQQVAADLLANRSSEVNDFPILWATDENGEFYKVGEAGVASRIMGGLDVKQPEEKSEVVEVSFVSTSPEEAAKIVNLVMNIYVESSTRQNRQAAASTADFLEKEKKEVKQKLDAAEQKLRRYMDSTGIVQVNEQANSMVTQRVDTEVELQKVNLELQTINQTIENYEEQLEKIKPGLSEQFANAVGPRIRNSQEELARYENERTLILTKNPGVLDRNPLPARLQYVNKQIERLKGEITELSEQLFTDDQKFMGMDTEDRVQMVSDIQSRLVELKIQQNQQQARREALAQTKTDIDSNFDDLPEGMVELAKLQRDVRINEELYMNVSRQFADMSVWKQSQFGYGRIVDPAIVPSVPVSPNKKILLLVGIMLGGVLASGFIFIKEFMDSSVNSIKNLQNIYPSNLSLSIIPTFENISSKDKKTFTTGHGKIPKEIVLFQDHTSIQSESIRRLKNNIIYQYGDTPPKTIGITSPEKGDGKSTIVANLGIAFAEEGYKTLIIDADFRRPKIQQYFGLREKQGLSDFLKRELTFKELLDRIQNTDISSLKVISAGQQTDRPETLGNNKLFREFINKMEEVFDVILLDTPPFGIISDATALLKGVESVLVVARYRKTNKEMLLRTIQELGKINANVTDIVLNDFDHKKETGSFYGSGYYQALYTSYEAYVK